MTPDPEAVREACDIIRHRIYHRECGRVADSHLADAVVDHFDCIEAAARAWLVAQDAAVKRMARGVNDLMHMSNVINTNEEENE